VQACLASKSDGERYPGAPPAFAPCGRCGSASQLSPRRLPRRSSKGRRRATKPIPLRRARCTRLPVKQS
jgi:hypothetical protein